MCGLFELFKIHLVNHLTVNYEADNLSFFTCETTICVHLSAPPVRFLRQPEFPGAGCPLLYWLFTGAFLEEAEVDASVGSLIDKVGMVAKICLFGMFRYQPSVFSKQG